MNSGVQRGRQAHIARYDQHQAACPADPGDVAPHGGALRMIVVPEYDAGQAARQPGDGASRVGQPF